MKLVDKILKNKENGIDCNESESAELKQFIKYSILSPSPKEIIKIKKIQMLFPLEYGEALDEMEAKN